MTTISIPRQQFLDDLETCLTVTKRIESNLFECEYITPALTKKIVIITTF